ncbi:hypothetical protein LINPERPRIM_LOCUS7192 [Linum perenne]
MNPPPTTSISTRGGTTKAAVADQISQTVQFTFNLLQLMHETSPSHAQLPKLPKNLLEKASTIRNTSQILEQLPTTKKNTVWRRSDTRFSVGQ